MYACVQNKPICKYMNIYTFPRFEQGRQTLRGKRRHTGFSPPGRLRAGGGARRGRPATRGRRLWGRPGPGS